MRKIAPIVAFTALALTGCSVGASQPAPTVTVTAEAPEPVNDFGMDDDAVMALMLNVWNDIAPDDQSAMCFLFDLSPDEAWDAFSDGDDEGTVSHAQWLRFFNSHC